jgi:hypothetical protein
VEEAPAVPIRLTALVVDRLIVPSQVYEPEAKFIVSPAVAAVIVAFTVATVVPDGQLQVGLEPEQVAPHEFEAKRHPIIVIRINSFLMYNLPA